MHHGDESQKEIYLQKLVSGEWTGTMNLTEPTQAPTWAHSPPRPSRPTTALAHLRSEDLHHLG